MKKTIAFLIILITFLNYQITAQTTEADSLANALKYAKEDTNKLNTLIELTNLGRLTNPEKPIPPDSLLKLINKSLQLAKKLECNSKLAVLYFRIGGILIYSQQYDSSFYYFDKAFEVLDEYEDTELESRVCTFAGTAHAYMGNYKKGLEWFQKALELSKKVNHKWYISQNLFSMGHMYKNMDEYKKAIDSYLKSLKYAEQLNDSLFIGRVYGAIAVIYESMKNYENASEYYFKALMFLDNHNTISLAVAFNNLGELYEAQNQTYKAIEFYNKALNIYTKLNKRDHAANTYNNLGKSYTKLGDYKKAYNIIKNNYEYFIKINSKPKAASSLYYLGQIYSEMEKYPEALDAYFESVKLYTELDRKYPQTEIFIGISKVYEKQKNYKKALEYYTLYNKLKDSLFNKKMNKQISELEIQYETEKKEQQIELQQIKLAQQEAQIQQQKILRNALFGGLGAVFIISLLAVYAYLMKKKANSKIAAQKEEIEAQAEHLKESNILLQQQALCSQMNPHFIFNTLNSIQYFIYENNKEASNKYLSRFSKLMRAVLENSQHQYIYISSELEALELYLELEALRFENTFEYTIQCDEEAKHYKIPTLLLQPYVENAVLHGIIPKTKGKGNITLRVQICENHIMCSIEDNGIGRAAAAKIKQVKKESRQSLGTKITEKRMDIANMLYGKKMKISYTDKLDEKGKPAGTLVEIRLPKLEI